MFHKEPSARVADNLCSGSGSIVGDEETSKARTVVRAFW